MDEWPPNSFSKKRKDLKILLRKEPPLADAFRPLLTEATRVHDLRSKIVHSFCQGTNLQGNLIFGHSAPKKGWSYTELEIGIPAVEQLSEDMRELRRALKQTASDFGINP